MLVTVSPEAIGVVSVTVQGPPLLVENSPVGEDDVSSTVTGSPAVYAVPRLVRSSTVSGAEGTPGDRVCGFVANARADGFQAANVRQAVVTAAPSRSRLHHVEPHAASAACAESAIAAASRTSSPSVCAVKSPDGMPTRFRGDHAKPKRLLPAEPIAYVCAET